MMHYRSGFPRCQQGFTLVEMMVALVVGLVVVAGVGQVFIQSKRTSAVQDELSRLQESGRYALHLLQEDIINTGYLGCGQTTNFNGNINSTGSYADNFAIAMNGYEASGSAWFPSLPTELGSEVVTGTDVVTIRYAQGSGLRLTQPKGAYDFQVKNLSTEGGVCSGGSDGYSGLCTGDLVIVSDCTKARTFSIDTNNSLYLAGGVLSIYHPSPDWGGPGDLDPNNYFNPAYSYLFKATTVSYFIRVQDGVPSLYRKIDNGNAQELVEGVENMQINYGVDTDGDNNPNLFQTAGSVADFGQVVSVRVALLLRTITEKANRPAATKTLKLLNADFVSPSDRHIRKVFSTTIQLRNRDL